MSPHPFTCISPHASKWYKDVPTVTHPIFGVEVPTRCPGVPDEVLDPRNTWADKAAYDQQARMLAAKFAENFEKYADEVSEEVKSAGPIAA